MSGTTKVVKNVNISSTSVTRREIISSIASTVRYSVPIITWGSSFGVSVGKQTGISSGSGSFRGRFGDHFGVGIISGAVQKPYGMETTKKHQAVLA